MSIRNKILTAKQIVDGISNCGSPFVEVYLDSMDCSVQAEISNPHRPQPIHRTQRFHGRSQKWLYGWKEADKCLACMGIKPSAAWADGKYKASRA
jgi:hypothetical protein